jgi:hypothetical protein
MVVKLLQKLRCALVKADLGNVDADGFARKAELCEGVVDALELKERCDE